MGNKLFQQAKGSVYRAEVSSSTAMTAKEIQEAQTKIKVAKNNVSSAFANSSSAEQHQLQELQQRIDEAQNHLKSGQPKKPKYF